MYKPPFSKKIARNEQYEQQSVFFVRLSNWDSPSLEHLLKSVLELSFDEVVIEHKLVADGLRTAECLVFRIDFDERCLHPEHLLISIHLLLLYE